MHPIRALLTRAAQQPATPLLTHIDGAAGTRIELSTISFSNNVAKTANLLRDEVGLESGETVLIDLPAHWQSAVWITSAWAVSATPVFSGSARCAISSTGDVDADERFVTALHPFGMPMQTELPSNTTDWAVAMRTHGDFFTPYELADVPCTHRDEFGEGKRVVVAPTTAEQLGGFLVDALTHGSSLILVTSPTSTIEEHARDEGFDVIAR